LQEAVLDWITYFLFFSYLCLDLLVDTLHWHEIAIALKRLDRCIVAKAPLNVGFAYLTVAGWIDGKTVWRHKDSDHLARGCALSDSSTGYVWT
jgi:hypothetical protein